MGSACLGFASSPFVTWLSLVSYRELRLVALQPVYPAFQWLKLESAGGPEIAALTCSFGIIVPALAAWWMWHYCVANFDRWVGRPSRNAPPATERTFAPIPAPAV